MLQFQPAAVEHFPAIQQFYWDVIEHIHKNNVKNENLGWEKGVYPSDDLLSGSIRKSELYMLTDDEMLCACVILNSACNEGFASCPWSIACQPEEVLIPHALAVHPSLQGRGIGKAVVENILRLARSAHKRAVRLDVLAACKAAERLYASCGFQFAEAKSMFYEDTGWTEYLLFERNL